MGAAGVAAGDSRVVLVATVIEGRLGAGGVAETKFMSRARGASAPASPLLRAGSDGDSRSPARRRATRSAIRRAGSWLLIL